MSLLKKYSYWIHAGKYTAIQKFAVLIMGVLSFMLLARSLGPHSYGVWGLFTIISSITETARTALIRNAFIRFLNQMPEEEHGRLQSAGITLGISVSVGVSVLFFALAYPVAHLLNAPELATMLQWYSLTILVSVAFAHFEMLLSGKMDFRGVCWMYCTRQAILLAVFVYCFFFLDNVSLSFLAIVYLLSVIVGSFTGYVFARKYLQWQFDNYKPLVKQLWAFGKYVFGNNLSSLLFRSTDNFITSNKLGTVVTAYYNVCLRMGNMVDMPSQVLGDVLFPKVAQFSSEDKSSVKYMYEKTVGAILIFSLPALILLVLFPQVFLYLLAGKDYLVAAPILRITAFFGFTLPFLKQFGTVMDATGHPDTNFKVMLSALGIAIVANLIGVTQFGQIGAAIGTATTYFIIFIVTQVILNRKFGINCGNVFVHMISLYRELFTNGMAYLTSGKRRTA